MQLPCMQERIPSSTEVNAAFAADLTQSHLSKQHREEQGKPGLQHAALPAYVMQRRCTGNCLMVLFPKPICILRQAVIKLGIAK